MRISLFICAVTLAFTSAALADHDVTVPYTASEMAITVDGDLSDWAGATWIACDEAYSGTASDLTSANYALSWSSATNLLYVAVQVTDTQQNLSDAYIAWNGQDGVELYVDAEIDENAFWEFHDVAQQVITGTDGATNWAVQIVNGVTETSAIVDSMATTINGDNIVYEYAITPYGYYAGFGGTVEAADRIATLASGATIGFDLVVSTKLDDGSFAMLCNNLTGGKHSQSIKFQTWTLASNSPKPGDADLDGDVDITDFLILKSNYGTPSGATWGMGDFDGDGDVDISDFLILKANYGT